MNPKEIYYDAPNGAYLVDVGEHYRKYSRKGPVVSGIVRFHKNMGFDHDEAKNESAIDIDDIEVERAVDWCGAVAGHPRGVLDHPGAGAILITAGPKLPEPVPGEFPFIRRVIDELLGGEPIQPRIFMAWLKGAYLAVREGVHQPAPLLAVAGPVNSGKSLLAYIVGQVLGGRVAHPHCAWSGGILWNDDLIGSEFLLIDDSVGSTDYRARLNFAANFKESVYGAEVQLRKRHASSMSVRPVWRVMACVNDEPENLEVLPPATDDMEDKMILLLTEVVEMPEGSATPEGKKRTAELINSELPALVDHLAGLEVPADIQDPRSGVLAWKHPTLSQALDSITPAVQLKELLMMAPEIGKRDPSRLPWEGSAAELESILLDRDSPTAGQARTLLRGARSLGRYLGLLEKKGDGFVQRTPQAKGIVQWRIDAHGLPVDDEDDGAEDLPF